MVLRTTILETFSAVRDTATETWDEPLLSSLNRRVYRVVRPRSTDVDEAVSFSSVKLRMTIAFFLPAPPQAGGALSCFIRTPSSVAGREGEVTEKGTHRAWGARETGRSAESRRIFFEKERDPTRARDHSALLRDMSEKPDGLNRQGTESAKGRRVEPSMATGGSDLERSTFLNSELGALRVLAVHFSRQRS